MRLRGWRRESFVRAAVVALACGSGCAPITARQARVWQDGGPLDPAPAERAVVVPELAAQAAALPDGPRRVVEAALGALDASEPGLDCSAFVRRVYAVAGFDLPRTVREQIRVGDAVRAADARPGDLVFFAFARRPADHVGIYAGQGQVVHVSSQARRVQIADLSSAPFASAWVATRRPRPAGSPDA